MLVEEWNVFVEVGCVRFSKVVIRKGIIVNKREFCFIKVEILFLEYGVVVIEGKISMWSKLIVWVFNGCYNYIKN